MDNTLIQTELWYKHGRDVLKASLCVFTDEQLEAAKQHPQGFIGTVKGINCYLEEYYVKD